MSYRNSGMLHGLTAAAIVVALAAAGPVQAKNLSRSTYNKLTEARELMDEDKHREALAKLEQLIEDVGKRDYEKALTLQALGYAYVGMDRDGDAIDAFEQALAGAGVGHPGQHRLGAGDHLVLGDVARAGHADLPDLEGVDARQRRGTPPGGAQTDGGGHPDRVDASSRAPVHAAPTAVRSPGGRR